MQTPFEIAQQQVAAGTIIVPTVSNANGNIPYFGYQLAVHVFNLSLMSEGMKCRGITFREIKNYYGLKGQTPADCLPGLKQIKEDYIIKLK